jgi:hypothetical protein
MMRHNKAILANMNHQGTPVVIDDKRGVASFASTFGTTLDYFQKNEEIMRHQKKNSRQNKSPGNTSSNR